MAAPLVENLSIYHRCPVLHRRRSHHTDGYCLLSNPQTVRVRGWQSFPVRLQKDCQIHAGLVSCEEFSDIVPSHYGYRKVYFQAKGTSPWRGNEEQKILGFRERGCSAVCGHDDAGDG